MDSYKNNNKVNDALHSAYRRYIVDLDENFDDMFKDPGFSSIIGIYDAIKNGADVNSMHVSSYGVSPYLNLLTCCLMYLYESKEIIKPGWLDDADYPMCYAFQPSFLKRVVPLLVGYNSFYALRKHSNIDTNYIDSFESKRGEFKYFYDNLIPTYKMSKKLTDLSNTIPTPENIDELNEKLKTELERLNINFGIETIDYDGEFCVFVENYLSLPPHKFSEGVEVIWEK